MYGVNGWHPHIHELLFLPAGVDLVALDLDVRARWSSVLLAVGQRDVNDHGFQLQNTDTAVSEYVTKFGRGTTWGPEHELTKLVVKSGRDGSRSPADLLAAYAFAGDELAGWLWAQYATVFKGRRQLVWSVGLRALLALTDEKTDEQLADEHDEDAVLLASLTLVQWRIVLANDARAEVLDIASGGDRDALLGYLSRLGVFGPVRVVGAVLGAASEGVAEW